MSAQGTAVGGMPAEATAGFHARLIAFAKVVFFFEAAVFVIRAVLLWALGRWDEVFQAGTFLSFSALAMMGMAWAILSVVKLPSDAWRRTADVTVLLVLAIPSAMLVAMSDPSNAGAASAASGIGIFFVLRGALVTTSGRETALVTGVAAIAAMLGFELVAAVRGVAYFDAALRLGIGLAIFVALAVVCSRIVYGLQRKVDEARRIGQYEIEAELGRGGMGVVYRAHHALMRRPTAVKVLPADAMDPEGVARFEREVRATAQLRHPNTIAVYDFGRSTDGSLYYAMELVDGLDLHHLTVRHGVLPPGRVVHVLSQMLGSLGEAHRHGLVHRDIKPGNALLARCGGEPDVVKVLDFGLAKDFGEETNLTLGGQVLGTPLYMAPEAMQGARHALPASDLYGVAATGYFLLTGTHPFNAPSKRELLRMVLEDAPEPPSTRRDAPVPADLERAILRGLAKRAEDRYTDAEHFRRVLAQADVAPWTRDDALAWWRDIRPDAPSYVAEPAQPLEATTIRERLALAPDLADRTGDDGEGRPTEVPLGVTERRP